MKTLDPNSQIAPIEADYDNYGDDKDSGGGMPLWVSLRVAMRGLTSNKMRTGLTMLGVIIGVAAVIAMVGMGQGASKAVASQINSLGTNLLTVNAGNPRLGFGGGGGDAALLPADAKIIATRFPDSIAAVAAQVRGSVSVKSGDESANTQAIGTTPDYLSVNNAAMQEGRFLTDSDESGRTKVAVLGTAVIGNLYGDATVNPIGQQILINRISFLVIGILQTKGAGGFGQDQDDVVIIPQSTALRRVFNRTNLSSISVECTSPKTMDLATEQISDLLRQRHHLQPPFPDNDDFRIRNQASLLETSQGITGTLTTLLAGVAIVSLAVGGIGIMNIMLVSVTERTREIGLRKAVGATSSDILMQFLIEALMMALLGGLIGVGVGIAIAHVISSRMGWETVIQPMVILVAVGVSVAIGVIFGLYPAAKAAKQSPIDALRHE